MKLCFNTQPPEGGWWDKLDGADTYDVVSTHSRLKAAGRPKLGWCRNWKSFNTQPPEGGWVFRPDDCRIGAVSTHSRLKAAGSFSERFDMSEKVSTHSRLKAAGGFSQSNRLITEFQHTAA